MKKKSIIILSIVGITLLIIAGFIAKVVTGSNKDNKESYDTYQVKIESPIKVTGKVSPESIKTYQNNAHLGDFVSVQANEGQRVTHGTPLINYDINPNKRNELYQQVRQAEAKGDQSAINQAWKQLNQYDGQVNDSVYATFNGIVSDIKKTNVGNGEPILKLIADEPQIKTTVSEFDLNKISVGDDVNVTVTSTGKKGKGKIKSISELPTSYDQNQQSGGQGAMSGADPSGDSGEGQATNASNPTETNPTGGDDSASSKYTVMIGDLDFDVRNGFSVEAEIPLDTMKLPSSVLTKDNHVYVVDKDGTVHKRQIKYNDNNGDLILKKGLKKGDKLIKNPDSDLKDGKKVEVSS
ncbi:MULTISPECIES: efflux RND transporter periplasmic adaptor subunit [Staphylococcus]|uniref:efflux RND transporter periplasmic adaptor subunit n=1 Tax=Staphylococcus TaxID=1279 RepID=UPI00208F800D|nr:MULTISPECIES: efflux RND transporter periplasmic adaptor subunit [Staphylococcus]MCO4330236.1 efflux RND transporter periplasmic adaptor subunit [Staphylococcus hyicus]MCO4332743.1 efflux RND transporter periplasmic adaptor subunit [Staphylococcus hyicus]MCO4335145.1 efflux RND transporter periplasmic adaptor subunit [Staphylococcus hyicus]MCO4337410.1 efflux RND transporter periplasmic adaptor subunit [Staphylococcus hyicus]MCO4339622.1 efflux RND transporter periplasmic adaptor subunit [S